jgi:serine/threonine-protein kinase HipA
MMQSARTAKQIGAIIRRARRSAGMSQAALGAKIGMRQATSGAIDFQYDQQWLDWEHTFAISLSLPLREDRYIGDPVSDINSRSTGEDIS